MTQFRWFGEEPDEVPAGVGSLPEPSLPIASSGEFDVPPPPADASREASRRQLHRYKEIEESVARLAWLPVPYALLQRLYRAARRPHVTLSQLVPSVSLVPGLACRVIATAPEELKVAPMVSVAEVATAMGPRWLRQVVIDAAEFAGVPELLESGPLTWRAAPSDYEDEASPETGIWGHSLAVALGCGLVAKRLGTVSVAEARLAGLLHDLGKEALMAAHPAIARMVRRTAQDERVPWSKAERKLRVPPHTLLGANLARKWGFPRNLKVALYGHHQPRLDQRSQNTPEQLLLTDIVIVGDAMARRAGLGDAQDDSGSPAWGALTRQRLGLTRADVFGMARRLRRMFQSTVMELLGHSARAQLPAEPSPVPSHRPAAAWSSPLQTGTPAPTPSPTG